MSPTTAICFLAMFLAAFAGVVTADDPAVLIPISIVLLVAAVAMVRSAAAKWLKTKNTLCVLFFCLAAGHAILSFVTAGLSSDRISITSRSSSYFAQALLIASIGLLAGATAYAWKLQRRSPVIVPRILSAANDHNVTLLFRVFLLAGSALMFFVYWKLGFTAYLSQPEKWPFMRYITSDLFGGSSTDEWLVNRAMDILTVALPWILFRILQRRNLLDITLAALSSFALLLPLRRANLLGVLLIFAILWGIEKRDLYRVFLKVVVSLVAIYVLSQCIFLWAAFDRDTDPRQIATIASTALPEIRDLGWVIFLLGGERLHGATFLQAAIPIPSIASDWSHTHSLRTITTKLIGLEQQGQTGGLRPTITGEGYINFGYFGVIAVGLLWGAAVGWSEQFLQITTKDRWNSFQENLDSEVVTHNISDDPQEILDSASQAGSDDSAGMHLNPLESQRNGQFSDRCEFVSYGAALCFLWICFFLYLAGTQAAASIKIGAILLLAISFATKRFHTVSSPAPATLPQ